MHVVIIGAGFGGLSAARKLAGAPVQVTVIDRSNHHLFQPLLYQVATAGLASAEISSPIRSVLSRGRNTEVYMAEVTGLDLERREVRCRFGAPNGSTRSIPYDYLVVATGARHSYFGHEEWEAHAPGLKSSDDALRLRRKILLAFETAEAETDPVIQRSLLTFVIVGGGPTGVELAGAIAELAHKALANDFRHVNPHSARILLIEAGPRVLAAFPEALSRKAQNALSALGVEVRVGSRVSGIDHEGVTFGNERITSKTVIWAAGVQASPAGAWLGTETDRAGRVVVDEYLHPPGRPEVFVLGDTASRTESGRPLPGIAPVAMQQGRYVARAIRALARGRTVDAPFRYQDKGNLATIGRAFAVADFAGMRLAGFPAWLLWVAVHIYYLIDYRNRLLVMVQWAWAYLASRRGARIITGEISLERREGGANR